MTRSRPLGGLSAAVVSVTLAACGGSQDSSQPSGGGAGDPPAAAATAASADDACPLTLDQVAAITGTPMTLPGGCTFFPANGRDVPHVFYILQNPMVCTTIQPGELGFTETVDGLPARAAYVADRIDGAHVLVCPDGSARAFDVVVDLANEKAKNREAAVTLAKQLLAAR